MSGELKSLTRALAAVLAVGLAGCEEHFARTDTITPWSGDAPAANAAMETINPFPRAAFDTRQVTQGSKVEDAMKIYRLPPAIPSTAPATSEIAPPPGPVSGGPTGGP